MKKLQLSILTATMICGAMFAPETKAQSGPCGWDLIPVISQPTCYKVCNGSISVAPTVNWDDFEYLWSNGSTSDMINDLCEDEYTVTVTDDKKCSQTYTYSIIEPAEIVASCITLTNESAPGAADGSIEASAIGGDGNYTFEWQTVPVFTGALISNLSGGTYSVIVYDGNDCTATTTCQISTDKKEECVGFRTQTQGGWGQCQQNGNNPGTYLFANFAAAFPNGLVIGCGSRHLTLTSAQGVCDFLPSGSSPKALPANANLINPGSAYKNVFAGQLVAATLNAQFDLYDANFGSNSSYTLGDLIITSGTFVGWSVNDLIAEANKKIGGCASPYAASALSDALSDVNENYVDGSIDGGYLVCPEKKDEGRTVTFTAENISVKIFPNPVSYISNVSIYSAHDQKMTIDVYNVAGQKVTSLFNEMVAANEFTVLNFDASELTSGIYFIRIVAENEVMNHKVIVNK